MALFLSSCPGDDEGHILSIFRKLGEGLNQNIHTFFRM